MELLAFILIGGFILAIVVRFVKRSKDRRDYEMVLKRYAEEAERIQAALPPLQPGALFTAAITPLPGNTIQFAIKLSPEAREIITRETLNPVRLLSYHNLDYAKEKREYDREQERLRRSPKIEDHIKANSTPEPEKEYDVTIEDFARPSGMTRSFPSASEAKAWAEQLRKGLEVFQRELEANETPAEASTFTAIRKS